jgi:hypothetical protein
MAIEGFQDLDFREFHESELPRRLASGNGAEASLAVEKAGSLAFRIPDGPAYTYLAGTDGISILPGEELADTVIEIDSEIWQGIVHDYESPPGLLYGGRVKCAKGKAMRLVAWEPGLRAMYTGRPLHDPKNVQLSDRRGNPLDVAQSFTLESDREEMAHFLRTAGYLFVRGVFSQDEAAGFREEALALRGEAVKGDKLSWWGKNADGEEILCRVTRAASRPKLRTIPTDPRMLGLKDLSDYELAHRARATSEEGVSVIYKHPNMTEGLSDIPWHRDCGMGGHAVMCPVLIASVFLTDAGPEMGELKMLPGSWTGTIGYMDPSDPDAPQGAGFRARPGDVSLHYGDVMHAAPPPTGVDLDQYRISAVTGYARPEARNHRGGSSYNDVLHGREDGQVEHLATVANRSSDEAAES